MAENVIQLRGVMKACCADESNRTPRIIPDASNPDMGYTRCSVCACRHFEFIVDPAVIGFEMKGIG